MDVSNRTWWIKVIDEEEGPVDEEEFQSRLRAGKVSLRAMIKSNYMDSWKPLLEIVASDETFRRPSQMPPAMPKDSDD